MRCLLTAAAALGLTFLPAASAFADCTNEVTQAFARQGNSDKVRKVLNLVGEQGPFKMTIEYVKPDRMRQVVVTLVEPDKPTETILVGKDAWVNNGAGWAKLPQDQTEQFITFFRNTTEQATSNVGLFECMGGETIDGQKLRAYKGLPPDVPAPADGDEQAKKAYEAQKERDAKNEALRVVYLDPQTNLPARIILARPEMLDKPIFKEVYSYPEDLKIDAPQNVKP